jgi:hypothetical protein
MRRIIVEDRDHTDTVAMIGGFSALFIVLAYFSNYWAKLPIYLGYIAGTLGCLLRPLFVMGRHQRPQDKTLDRIRAAYVLATGDLIAGRERAASRRLQKIRSLERHWRFGASHLFRTALFQDYA